MLEEKGAEKILDVSDSDMLDVIDLELDALLEDALLDFLCVGSVYAKQVSTPHETQEDANVIVYAMQNSDADSDEYDALDLGDTLPHINKDVHMCHAKESLQGSVGVYESKKETHSLLSLKSGDTWGACSRVAMVDVLRVMLCAFLGVIAVLVLVMLLAAMNNHGSVTMLCALCVVFAMVCLGGSPCGLLEL